MYDVATGLQRTVRHAEPMRDMRAPEGLGFLKAGVARRLHVSPAMIVNSCFGYMVGREVRSTSERGAWVNNIGSGVQSLPAACCPDAEVPQVHSCCSLHLRRQHASFEARKRPAQAGG